MIERRLIGKLKGDPSGPVAVFIGGVHGNEPAGVYALKRVLTRIVEDDIPLKGSIYSLAGNLTALREGVRYVDKDLNRIWFTKINENHDDLKNFVEFSERDDLIRSFKEIINEIDTQPYFFDLHTTSSQSVPFISISDTLRNRKLVENLKTPVILGLEERMEGTLFSYFGEIGIQMVLYEGGQHDEVSSIDNIESFIWIMLMKLGMIKPEDIHDFNRYVDRIARENVFEKAVFEKNVYELKYRYDLNGRDQFKMKSGYVNFQRVSKGEKVASDNGQEIKIPFASRIFMPLYQAKGSDGFFLIKHINGFWLTLSERLRKFGLDKYMVIFPGIKKHPDYKSTYTLSPFIARSFALKVFHLLGYRRVIRFDEKFVVSRRPYDWHSPSPETIKRNFNKLIEPLPRELEA